MNDLLNHVLTAHGGLERWSQIGELSVDAQFHGPFWKVRGFSDEPFHAKLTAETRQERIRFSPWAAPGQDMIFDRSEDQVSLVAEDGGTLESRTGIRSTYGGYDLASPWESLQVGYFLGYAMWNYLTTPFLFTYPGMESREGARWEESGEAWRRLHVKYPDSIAAHSSEQTFYFAENGMLRRLDYNVDVNVGVAVAQYVGEYKDFHGIIFPTRRRVHRRNPDNSASENWSIGIEIENVTMS
ncbi:hypothetical protein ACWDRB_52900 [Nonomuraea sp. NPDC003707]